MTNKNDDTKLKPKEGSKDLKIYSLIGLAMKSRNLVSGEFATEKSIQSNQAYLVVIACDASANTKKKFTNKCTYYDVPLCFFGTKELLGKAIGKESRSSIALTDRGLAQGLKMQLENRCSGDVYMED